MADDVKQLNNLRVSLAFVLQHEGGWENDPSDPGGETKWGISKRAYPRLDIANLTPEQASDIYANDYWLPTGCDSLPLPYCTVVLDSAVLHGVAKAVYWLRQAENIRQYLNLRRMFYYALVKQKPTEAKFMNGWLARLNDLTKFVDVSLAQAPVPDPVSNQETPRWGGGT